MEVLGTYTPPKPLVIDDFPRQTDTVTFASGSVYAKGSVLALDASGNAVLVNSASTVDSVKVPLYVAAEDVDATSAAVKGTVFLTGAFNQAALTFGGTDTYATHKAALRKLSIFLKPILS